MNNAVERIKRISDRVNANLSKEVIFSFINNESANGGYIHDYLLVRNIYDALIEMERGDASHSVVNTILRRRYTGQYAEELLIAFWQEMEE